jgi:enamine deaminase RidA (YjgF/YER057c/UK114 family)
MSAPIYHLIRNAPKPVAPYSHVVEADGWLFVTGQLATDPDDDSLPLPEGIEAQTRKVMDNLKRALAGTGAGFEELFARAYFSRISSATTLPSTGSTPSISGPTSCQRGPQSGSRTWHAAALSKSI